jgi:hypothetical protein
LLKGRRTRRNIPDLSRTLSVDIRLYAVDGVRHDLFHKSRWSVCCFCGAVRCLDALIEFEAPSSL